jgi:uncharacterized protein (UPF0332 family)
MDPSEFLELAIRLSAGSREADLRTSVSRAHYGAFHVALAFVEGLGVRLPKTAAAHDKLRHCLLNSDHAASRLAGSILESLRSERNEADYHLRSPRFANRKYTLVQLELARKVADAVAACDHEPVKSRLAVAIRKYAQTIGLPLEDV